MKASVFFDAFAECVVGVGMAKKDAGRIQAWRAQAVLAVIILHGPSHVEATGRMFDRLWRDMQNPKGT